MSSSMWLVVLASVLAVTPCLSQTTCPIIGCTADQCQTITVNATRPNGPGRDYSGGNFGRGGGGGGGRGRGLLHGGGGGGRGFNGTVWTCATCDDSANFQPVLDGPFNTTRCVCKDGYGRTSLTSTTCDLCPSGSVPLGPNSGLVPKRTWGSWTVTYVLGNSSTQGGKGGRHGGFDRDGRNSQLCVACPTNSTTSDGITCVNSTSSGSSSSTPSKVSTPIKKVASEGATPYTLHVTVQVSGGADPTTAEVAPEAEPATTAAATAEEPDVVPEKAVGPADAATPAELEPEAAPAADLTTTAAAADVPAAEQPVEPVSTEPVVPPPVDPAPAAGDAVVPVPVATPAP